MFTIKAGLVLEWQDGSRWQVDCISTMGAYWWLRSVNTTPTSQLMSEADIYKDSWPCDIQPGDLYEWRGLKDTGFYKVMYPISGGAWRLERDDGMVTLDFNDHTIRSRCIKVEGIQPKSLPVKPKAQDRCTVCGTLGAQILFNMVDCPNYACRCYRGKK